LIAASAFPQEKTAKVTTVNDPEQLKGQARILAERLGTQEREKAWEAAFDKTVALIKGRAAQKGVGQIQALVQQHQVPFVKWLGYSIVGTFSANELSPSRIIELAALKPALIIDNYHNPQGRPNREVVGCAYAELRNFPSTQAPTLEALFLQNAALVGLQ
jgi:zinc transport system substrate-binding protein